MQPPAATSPAACRALAALLPERVEGGDRREVRPPSDATAAWHDPPIVLRCGVARPAGLSPTAELVTVNGVDWFPQQRDDGYVFTTYGRSAYVEVRVPDDYAPEVNALVDLAGAVTAAVPTTGPG